MDLYKPFQRALNIYYFFWGVGGWTYNYEGWESESSFYDRYDYNSKALNAL